jgi:membrane protease YdiL (CAAX protease family)
MAETTKTKPGRVRGYLATSRDPLVAALLVFPVYLLYQVGLAITPGIRNGADLVTALLVRLRAWQPAVLWSVAATVVLVYAVVLWRLRRRNRFSPTLFGLVALEGAVHGVVMFVLINEVMRALLMGGGDDHPFPVDVVLSLGAGFHEELVFRVLLLGGLVFLGAMVVKGTSVWLVLGAAVVSSLAFSAVHYVGPLADPFTVGSFVFRFLAGCYFAAIYRLRGFAVAVYTHAIYDIGVFAFT